MVAWCFQDCFVEKFVLSKNNFLRRFLSIRNFIIFLNIILIRLKVNNFLRTIFTLLINKHCWGSLVIIKTMYPLFTWKIFKNRDNIIILEVPYFHEAIHWTRWYKLVKFFCLLIFQGYPAKICYCFYMGVKNHCNWFEVFPNMNI